MSSTNTQEELVLAHVEEQRSWYDKNATRTMHWHQWLRTLSLGCTVLIPVFALVGTWIGFRIIAAALGAVAAFSQGFEAIHQYREHYIAWRYTAEQLEREEYMYRVKAGDYAAGANTDSVLLLAQRADAITSQENQQWLALQQKADTTSVAQGNAP